MGRPSRFSMKLVKEICDKIADGKTMEEICRENDAYPCARTVRRWQQSKPRVHDEVCRAYDLFFQVKHTELEELSLEKAPKGLDKMELMAYNADKRARIDALKFSLAKLAPMFSRRFDTAKKLAVSGENLGPIINVVSWADITKEEVNGSI